MTTTTSRCIVHIGAPKTGSTLIQRVLFENRDVLEAHGIRYPDVSLRGFGHHDLAFLLAGGYPDWATAQSRTLDDLAKDLKEAASDYRDSLLFSSEDFYLFPKPAALREFLSENGVLDERIISIVVYVRRQDDAHESWYNQTIKAQGYTHNVARCVEEFRELWDYRTQLQKWADAFGDEAVVVRPYETESYVGGTLLADFFSLLDIPLEKLHISSDRVNTSLNADLLEFQRLVNTLPMAVQEKRKFHKQLIELSEATRGAGVFDESSLIDSEQRSQILDSYAKGNAEIARRFLRRPALFLNESTKQRRAASSPGLTSEKIAAILSWLLTKGL